MSFYDFFILLCTYIIFYTIINKKHAKSSKKQAKVKDKKCMGICKFLIYEATIIILTIILINVYVLSFSIDRFFSHIEDIEPGEIGLVLWASVKPDWQPSNILKDRLDTAIIFYNQEKINKILVSGDNGTHHYNEPVAMQKYLITNGIPESDIYLDYAGFDTYDSLYRARDIFGSQDLIIFTQWFHLHRAVYISKRLGLNVVWVTTDIQKYLGSSRNSVREVFARVKAFFEVEILKPSPKYLWDPIEIVTNKKIDQAKQDVLNEGY